MALAFAVVLYHGGALTPLTGHSAVFGFFMLSGYLMARVIDDVYGTSPRGAIRFYGNRVLRIMPPYLLVVVVTAVMVRVAGAPAGTVHASASRLGAGELLSEMTLHMFADPFVIARQPVHLLVPQGWSLGVEMWFYLAAPAIVVAWRRGFGGPLMACAVAYTAVLAALRWPFYPYRYSSFLGALFVFLAGVALHRHGARHAVGAWSRAAYAGMLLAWLALPVLADGRRFGFEAALVLLFVMTALVARLPPWPRWLTPFDQWCGRLSYGVFLTHILVALLLFHFVPDSTVRRGGPLFCALVLTGSVACSWLIHQTLERPLERVRGMLRGRPNPALAPDLRVCATPVSHT